MGLQDAIDHVRNFSELMHGAALLYNLMLTDRLNHAEWIEKYREALSEWAETSRSEEHAAWDRGAFWRVVRGVNSRIAPTARSFYEDWFAQVFGTPNLAEIADSRRAQELVRAREKLLKGPRSRLDHREYLELWGGVAGSSALDYRWGVTQTMVEDILNGLGVESVDA